MWYAPGARSYRGQSWWQSTVKRFDSFKCVPKYLEQKVNMTLMCSAARRHHQKWCYCAYLSGRKSNAGLTRILMQPLPRHGLIHITKQINCPVSGHHHPAHWILIILVSEKSLFSFYVTYRILWASPWPQPSQYKWCIHSKMIMTFQLFFDDTNFIGNHWHDWDSITHKMVYKLHCSAEHNNMLTATILVREALKKITILSLPPPLFIDEKPLYKKCL